MDSNDFAIEVSAQEVIDAPERIGNQTLQRMTDGKYATAIQVQRPRRLVDVERRVLEEAALLGERAFYGWGAGKDMIEGPSQELAHALARQYGNCAVAAEPVQDEQDAWVMTAAFIDLETGFTLTRQFRQSKRWTVYGRHDNERKDDIRFQIGQSKAARNVILKAIPSWLTDKAMKRAKQGVRENIQRYIDKNGIQSARTLAVGAIKKHGVDVERLLAKLQRPTVDAIALDDLVILKGDIQALDDGAELAETLYPYIDGQKTDADGKSRTDKLADALAEAGETKPKPVKASVPPRTKPIVPPVADPEPAAPVDDLALLQQEVAGHLSRIARLAVGGEAAKEVLTRHGVFATKLAACVDAQKLESIRDELAVL